MSEVLEKLQNANYTTLFKVLIEFFPPIRPLPRRVVLSYKRNYHLPFPGYHSLRSKITGSAVIFTYFGRKVMYGPLLCPKYILLLAIHSYTQLYTAIRGYTQLYRTIASYTRLYRAIHSYTRLYTAIQGFTQLYRAIHNCTEIYTAVKSYTQLDRLINSYTGLYTAIQRYT